MLDLEKWVRPNILTLKPYSSARDEFKGEASVFLDANENPYNAPYNRYPDPLQWGLKKKIAEIKGVAPEQIFLGVGSDECIDVLFRAFCVPGRDNVVAIDPTYGMYKVCADINDVEYRPVRMNEDFDFDADTLLENVDDHTKLIFFCSPNNPSGNNLPAEKIAQVLQRFAGIVVVDEAYIDFSSQPGFLPELPAYDNLVVMHTFSKAWGAAAVRRPALAQDAPPVHRFGFGSEGLRNHMGVGNGKADNTHPARLRPHKDKRLKGRVFSRQRDFPVARIDALERGLGFAALHQHGGNPAVVHNVALPDVDDVAVPDAGVYHAGAPADKRKIRPNVVRQIDVACDVLLRQNRGPAGNRAQQGHLFDGEKRQGVARQRLPCLRLAQKDVGRHAENAGKGLQRLEAGLAFARLIHADCAARHPRAAGKLLLR